ncbi:MAG: hypothetical protein AAFQ57_01925 [Cyanobacteria bacterium J06626_14]
MQTIPSHPNERSHTAASAITPEPYEHWGDRTPQIFGCCGKQEREGLGAEAENEAEAIGRSLMETGNICHAIEAPKQN